MTIDKQEFALSQAKYDLAKVAERLFSVQTEDLERKLPFDRLRGCVESFAGVALDNKECIVASVLKTEAVSDYTISHSMNVCLLSLLIADEFGYEGENLINVGIAGLVHDVGKRFIDKDILFKQGALSEEELETIHNHPTLGAELLRRTYAGIPEEVLAGVMWHHERMDGAGYPDGRRRYGIHEVARIIAIADVLEAFVAIRPYHGRRSLAQGIDAIQNTPGLDKNLIDVFVTETIFYPEGLYVILSDRTVAMVVGEKKGMNPDIAGLNGEEMTSDKTIIGLLQPVRVGDSEKISA